MEDDAAVRALLDELAEAGRENDARETERARRFLNVAPETGQLLAILIRATGAQRILEIGTSNGYSTIWLGWAARETGGHVTTIERAADKVAMAKANLARAGLSERVTIQHGPALDVLMTLPGPFDLVFLDADRPNYLAYLDLLVPRVRRGGLLVTDNVRSHAHELGDFLRRLRADPGLETVTVETGNGQEVTYKR
ncbi:MAG TPA: O-methyltransferase [bacterium]|nr:O-methyltransferase [bacterium]